ncbi:type II toxin-antitoxin system RelE/ParE family toxin [Sphingobium scionense]
MKWLLFTPAAQADLSDIWDYSAATWGVDQADLYIDAIRDVCLALADGRRPGCRSMCGPAIARRQRDRT